MSGDFKKNNAEVLVLVSLHREIQLNIKEVLQDQFLNFVLKIVIGRVLNFKELNKVSLVVDI